MARSVVPLLPKEQRVRETWQGLLPTFEESYVENPTAGLEVKELKQRIWAAVNTLPLAQREVFLLHRFGGLSCPRVAEVTGVNLKTVESRLRLALTRLVDLLPVRESAP